MSCRIARSKEWTERLVQESQYWDSSVFVTLTFRSTIRPYSVSRKEVQDFFKRLRYELDGARIKYYASGEYGEKLGGAHYHGIIFGLGECGECFCCSKYARKRGRAPKAGTGCAALCAAWPSGFVHVSGVGPESCGYVAGYVTKFDSRKLQGRAEPFSLKSQGIGERWLRENFEDVWKKKGMMKKGVIVSLPRYYVKLADRYFRPRPNVSGKNLKMLLFPFGGLGSWFLSRVRWRVFRNSRDERFFERMTKRNAKYPNVELGKERLQRKRNLIDSRRV